MLYGELFGENCSFKNKGTRDQSPFSGSKHGHDRRDPCSFRPPSGRELKVSTHQPRVHRTKELFRTEIGQNEFNCPLIR